MFKKRISKLIRYLENDPIDLIAINAGQSLTYFTGLHFHESERPAVLLIGKRKIPAFIFPEFEYEKVNNAALDIMSFAYSENPSTWGDIFKKALQYLNGHQSLIGVEPTAMRFLETNLLQLASAEIRFTSAAHIFKNLRTFKDNEEIRSIRQAIQIAETALENTISFIKAGVTEQEIANELVINLLRNGSEPELPFAPIVASGPNSANPHAVPGSRKLRKGDLILIDWGARKNGYISDITRTFALGNLDDKLMTIYEIVKRSNEAARNISPSNFVCEKIDSAARDIIQDAGFGNFFTHRTGHGIGLEAHEEPYITTENPTEILPGMTFTIEPGIYLPGKGGVRIEDDIVASNNGLTTLTTLNRDLMIL
ncbi:MAG: aminopeptidase P family protein [Anaerolineaceae bacterium]|nr:aminopeptidase P family protein [Anaerolineaceae bacterium]